MNLNEAEAVAGRLSHPSKMPCPSWGLSPRRCITGSKLRRQPGTVCSSCYACKGHYVYPAVILKHESRFENMHHPQWVDAMVTLIRAEGNTYFRWFDSGDLQSHLHLLKIILIAVRMPEVQFWLPTQELRLLQSLPAPIPDNLIIRYTLPLVNTKKVPRRWPWQSEVVTDMDKVDRTSNDGYVTCPASWDENIKSCRQAGCRACWSKAIRLVIYRRH